MEAERGTPAQKWQRILLQVFPGLSQLSAFLSRESNEQSFAACRGQTTYQG